MTNHNSPLARWTASKHTTDAIGGTAERAPEKRKFISPLSLFARRQQAIPPVAQAPGLDENDTANSRDAEPSLSDLMSKISAPEAIAEAPLLLETDADEDEFSSDLQFVELEDDLDMRPVDADILTDVAEQSEKSNVAEEDVWVAESDSDLESEETPDQAETAALANEADPAPVAVAVEPAPAVEEIQDVPTPVVAPPPARNTSRVKTTFLGFERSDGRIEDVFDRARDSVSAERIMFPVGWMVVVDGPGRGTSFTLLAGVSQIGRGEDQAVQLNFGDNGISRSNHAAIAYDDEERKFYLGHGGKSNIVRLNGKPVLSTEPLGNGDRIRIGETTLSFVAFCGADFNWSADN